MHVYMPIVFMDMYTVQVRRAGSICTFIMIGLVGEVKVPWTYNKTSREITIFTPKTMKFQSLSSGYGKTIQMLSS